MHGFRRKARALGVEYRHDEVVSVEVNGGRIAGLGLRKAGALACGTLVNAAGPRAGALAALAGAELPVGPRKRMTYVFDCRAALPPLPLIIDVTGVACRPEGGQYLAIVSPPEHRDRVCEDFELEYDSFETVIWPALAHRVPAFEAIKLVRAWACHYDYNSFDQNAVLGPHPEIAGLLFCNGFSGHGVQQAPAAGRATAEWIVHGGFRSLDLSALLYARIAEGRPVRRCGRLSGQGRNPARRRPSRPEDLSGQRWRHSPAPRSPRGAGHRRPRRGRGRRLDRRAERGALAMKPTGEPFTQDGIGMALANRELMQGLRDAGEISGGPRPFNTTDRSNFLNRLETTVQAAKRRGGRARSADL
jgi:hypothetical protein